MSPCIEKKKIKIIYNVRSLIIYRKKNFFFGFGLKINIFYEKFKRAFFLKFFFQFKIKFLRQKYHHPEI